MDTPDRPTDPSEAVTPAPWYQRAVTVSAVGVGLVGLVALLSPAFRDQIDLSTSRRPDPFVELYFAQSASSPAQAVCTKRGSSVRVRFVVESHLQRREAMPYRLSLDPSEKGLPTQRKKGSADVSPGVPLVVRKSFTLPRGEGYTLSVVLPDLDQGLRAHCREPRR